MRIGAQSRLLQRAKTGTLDRKQMQNAAPFIARPARRIAAGIVDLVVLLLFVILAFGIVSHTGQTPYGIEVVLVTYALYHFVCFSSLHGTTAGLQLFDMQIVAATTGRELTLGKAFARGAFRPALFYAVWLAATYGDPFPQMKFAMVITPLFVEVVMMFTSPTRQTLSDFVTRTLVINVPPPQPHRAPAAPMYSATDAEFGVQPRKIERSIAEMRSNSMSNGRATSAARSLGTILARRSQRR